MNDNLMFLKYASGVDKQLIGQLANSTGIQDDIYEVIYSLIFKNI